MKPAGRTDRFIDIHGPAHRRTPDGRHFALRKDRNPGGFPLRAAVPADEYLSATDGAIKSVWSYDPTTRSWQHFRGGGEGGAPAEISTLKTLEPGKAYWIETNRATTLISDRALSGKVLYYHPDHLGSTSFATNQQGKILSETHYYPFGRPRLRTGTDPNGAEYLYTGKELDRESGLMYYEARYMDPVVGRFISVDPLISDIGKAPYESGKETKNKYGILFERLTSNPQENNYYSYTSNNPIIFIDLLGLYWEYSQSTGQVIYVENQTGQRTVVANGYSGNGQGLNNPNMQNQVDVGPIPRGTY